ncbi:phage portal protein [Pseudoxanthomonas winnipegensis]|uniref:Phage portal protein n=1 Tax=Pseudoxanthomonas winnipegensis TaxID=2480810 RepID=A0A4V2HDH9_9GAMM|nr:phage portal protein [Pseudoxanthomonas winnipegensis]TAA27660.1 phage portal protein [Pseudoxanthomonas winnipegensis]
MGTAATARQRLLAQLPDDKRERDAFSARQVLARAHEVTRPSRSRKLARDWGSGSAITGMDAKQLRDQARHLERDLDLADNALNILVQNTCGSGIDVLAAPRHPGRPVDRGLARDIDHLWDAWWDAPEVTGMHDYGRAQQLMARSWFRDGEMFFQDLVGPVSTLPHGTEVPYSFEMLEADMVPLDLNDPASNVVQGAERNAWGRVVAWHVYKQHPGDIGSAYGWANETKRVSADNMRQLALVKRLHQVRGLSVFASAMSRFEDIKDYEESERIAAKVAASMCAYIKRAADGTQSPLGTTAVLPSGQPVREMRMTPGMIWDDLLPGEDVGIINSNRPNAGAAEWVTNQLRRAAGGIGTSFSSLSLDYNGTYSAQRQELVEKWGGYLIFGEQFIAQAVRKQRTRFIEAALLAGLIRIPRGWSFQHVAAATYVRPVMPWIDPLKEATARGEAEDRGWVSPQQNTLQYGNNPEEVAAQRQDWQQRNGELGLHASAPASPEARADFRRGLTAQLLTRD